MSSLKFIFIQSAIFSGLHANTNILCKKRKNIHQVGDGCKSEFVHIIVSLSILPFGAKIFRSFS
jgi:hypothetical protein